MSEVTPNSLHKEFELERMILFSDAVFAIAITLLIIEVKFPELPEDHAASIDLFKLFKPTIREFLAFLISFFFIGISWSRHLKMFRYLRAYDDKVIILNLLSLLFIVTFPFSASAAIHIKDGFLFPMIIYLANIMLVMGSSFFMARYIFKKKAQLSVPGHDAEKNYIYLQSKYPAILLTTVFIIVTSTYIISNYNFEYTSYSIYSMFIGVIIMQNKLRKHKPKKNQMP
jgi:uncharacterized membrane protein